MASQSKTRSRASAASGEFTCPECGRSFGRAAALGAHRSRAHGVAGATKRSSKSSAGSRSRAASATAQPRGRRTAGAATGDGPTTVNRDALLKTLFPSGIPARESVVRAVNSWLDEAERLARTR
jgi:hypothetical protein